MPICFKRGEILGRGDLALTLQTSNGTPQNAFEIAYSLYFVDESSGDLEVALPPLRRTPENPTPGEYYAPVQVPPTAPLGRYRVRWFFMQFAGSDEDTVIEDFGVVEESTILSDSFSEVERECIRTFRILTRDNNPDRNYRFPPPDRDWETA